MQLPPRPKFSTERFRVAGSERRDLESWSVQRSWPFVVVPRPSVMESPRTAIAALFRRGFTSMELMVYQWSVFAIGAEKSVV